MKIALINGSPKVKTSASEYLLTSLKGKLPDDSEFQEFKFNTPKLNGSDLEQIADKDVLIFAFPLYVDAIPSHLLNCLSQMETYFSTIEVTGIRIYALVNCGFYEGHQGSIALEIMKNWCTKAKMEWGQGIGIGGGGMLASFEGDPKGHGPVKNLWDALNRMAANVSDHHEEDDIYTVPNFPRAMYALGGNMGWRRQIKENGLTQKDLQTKK